MSSEVALPTQTPAAPTPQQQQNEDPQPSQTSAETASVATPPALQRLFELINSGDDPGAVEQALLLDSAAATDGSSGVSLVHATDEHGLTALHQAAYRGRARVCAALLDRGARVNGRSHHQRDGYTPLHFAALSGSVATVYCLLAAGANCRLVNSVGRTPAQMAAFVGNHRLVTAMASYVPRSVVDSYTVPSTPSSTAVASDGSSGAAGGGGGGSKTASDRVLPPHLAPATHALLLDTNIHPVHVLMWACSGGADGSRSSAAGDQAAAEANSGETAATRLQYANQLAATLDQIMDRYARKHQDTDSGELVALKAHYLAQLLRIIQRQQQQLKLLDHAQLCQQLARKWLLPKGGQAAVAPSAAKASATTGPMVPLLDSVVRECIKSFNHRELPAFRGLVTALVHGSGESGGGGGADGDEQSEALRVLSATLNCRSGFGAADTDTVKCATCGETGAGKQCSACHTVSYCDRACQRIHWPLHKTLCRTVGDTDEKVAARCRTSEKQQTDSATGGAAAGANGSSGEAKDHTPTPGVVGVKSDSSTN